MLSKMYEIYDVSLCASLGFICAKLFDGLMYRGSSLEYLVDFAKEQWLNINKIRWTFIKERVLIS